MSQNVRKVVVASPTTSKAKKYETSATTWGELQEEIAELIVGDVDAIVKPGNVTLKRNDATLPTGDFNLYLIPTKNKAGMTPSQAQTLAREIGDAIVKAASVASDDEVSSLKEQLVETIEDFFGISLEDDCPECEEALRDAQNYV